MLLLHSTRSLHEAQGFLLDVKHFDMSFQKQTVDGCPG